MNTFALEIWDDEGSKCTFYTVRIEEALRKKEIVIDNKGRRLLTSDKDIDITL